MDKQRLNTYRSFIHPIMSISIPFLFVWTLTSVLSSAIKSFQTIPSIFPLLLLAVGIAEAAVSNFLYKEKVGEFLPRLRELFLILILSFFILLVLTGKIFGGNWQGAKSLLKINIIFPLVAIIFSWAFSYYVHNKLRDRELFLSILIGVEPRNLTKTFREFHFEAGEASDGIRGLRKLVIGFQVVIFVLILLSTAMSAQFTVGAIALVMVNFAFGLFFYISLIGFSQAQDLFGEGYAMSKEIQGRRFRFGLLVVLIGGLLMIPIVRPEPPLPSSILSNFMAWLEEKLRLPEVEVEPEKREIKFSETQGDSIERVSSALGGVAKEQNERLQAILRAVIIGLLVGIPALAFVLALIVPLFRKRGKGGVHPLKMVAAWFSRIWETIITAIRSMGSSLRDFRKRAQVRRGVFDNLFGGAVTETDEEGKRRRGGLFRRLTLARNIKTFLKLIRWGEKRGVKFLTCFGPKEYLEMVGGIIPDIIGTLVEIADLFEEQLFSTHDITNEMNTAYFDKVRLVLRYR